MAIQGFDKSYYLTAKLNALKAAYTEWSTKTTTDLEAYLTNVGMTAEQHYTQFGWGEGLAPNAYFNAAEYKAAKAADMFAKNLYVSEAAALAAFNAAWTADPYEHYLAYGGSEGINPSNAFDASEYLDDKLADLQADSTTSAAWTGKTAADLLAAFTAAGYTPLTHYEAFGTTEGLTVTAVPADEQVDSSTTTATTGTSFTLTTATDTFTGTSGNDTVIGDWGTTSVNASDQLTFGAGTDTLKVYGTLGTLPASMSGLETLVLVNPGGGTITDTTVGFSGITRLSLEQASTTAAITTTSNSGLTLDLATANNGTGAAITWAANATDTSQTLELSGYAGAATATKNNFNVTGAATTTMNINTDTAASGITTLTLPTTATTVNIDAEANLTVSTSLAATAAKTVNVSGAGKVTISGSDFAAAVTVDGSTNTGGVVYTAEAAGSTLTFKGGSGNDSVTFAAGTLTTADVLTGGTGTDTIVIADTALTTAGGLAHVNAQTGFETLGLNADATSLDLSLLTNGMTNVYVASGNYDITTTNSLSTTTYTIANTAGNTGTVSIGNKVGELSTTVTLDYGTATANQTLVDLTVNGATNVSLVSTGTGSGGSNTITTLNNMDNSVFTITGSKDLTITNAIDGTGTGSKIDASAFTGKLSVVGSGQADIITGGTGADTFNGGAGLDTISGGAGADNFIVANASQADVLTGGDGADSFKFTGDATDMFKTSTGTSAIVSITDFAAGTDKIALLDSATAFTSITLATQTIATAASLTAVWSGITAIAASADNGALAASLITVSAGTAAGTYLYVNDTNAAVSNTLDMLVKLTGITGTLATTDFVFA